MAALAAKRLHKELADIIESEKTKPHGIKMEIINGNVFYLRAEMKGPLDTPYEGGTFVLEFEMPRDYPSRAPLINFKTKMWHVNICPEYGYIRFDKLLRRWDTSRTLKMMLLSIQGLLSSPNPQEPKELEVALKYHQNPELFDLTARHWTHVYAGGPYKNQSFDDKISKMMKLGVPEGEARIILSVLNWDLEFAINDLFQKDDPEEDNSNKDDDNSNKDDDNSNKDDDNSNEDDEIQVD